MPIAETGMPVYWADGQRTTFNLLGDLQTARFPNTDEGFDASVIGGPTGQRVPGFFDWFGGNWATPPADGRPGIRQSLVVDSHTIQTVGRLLELMRDGDNEWDVPPGPITDLMMHAAAATRFPQGWQASRERAKYLPGSVATDKPRPGPAPGGNARELDTLRAALAGTQQEAQTLQAKLAESIKARETAVRQYETIARKSDGLLSTLEARAKGMKTAAGARGGGKYAQALRAAAEGLEKTVADFRANEKAGA
jgi:hypothetical protein